jgi:hypothetical protein
MADTGRISLARQLQQGQLAMDKPTSTLLRIACALAASTLCIAAQAGNQITDDKIAVAKSAIAHAEQAGAPETAAVELALARDKLAQAEKANAAHAAKPAADLADQANVDAQVAEATATQLRSNKAAAEFDASLQTLRQEAARSSSPAQ